MFFNNFFLFIFGILILLVNAFAIPLSLQVNPDVILPGTSTTLKLTCAASNISQFQDGQNFISMEVIHENQNGNKTVIFHALPNATVNTSMSGVIGLGKLDSTNGGKVNAMIVNAKESDLGKYTCNILVKNTNGSSQTYNSNTVTVNSQAGNASALSINTGNASALNQSDVDTDNITRIWNEIQNFDNFVDKVSKEIRRLNTALAGLFQTDYKIDSTASDLNQTKKNLKSAKITIEDLKKKLTSIQDKFSQNADLLKITQKKLNNTVAKVQKTDAAFNKTGEKLKKDETEISILATDMKNQQQIIEAFKTKFNNFGSQLNENKKQISEFENEFDKIKERLDETEKIENSLSSQVNKNKNVSKFENNFNEIKKTMKETEEKHSKTMSRIEEIEAKLKKIEEVQKTSANSATSANATNGAKINTSKSDKASNSNNSKIKGKKKNKKNKKNQNPDDKLLERLQNGKSVLVLRRNSGDVTFDRNYADYQEGFGETGGNFWIGLETLHKLTRKSVELKIKMTHPDGTRKWAKYSHLKVDDESSGYKLHVSGFSGPRGIYDNLEYHNGMKFTTWDKDQDQNPRGNCAETTRAGFWFRNCVQALPTGVWYDKGERIPNFGIYWNYFTRQKESLVFVEYRIKLTD